MADNEKSLDHLVGELTGMPQASLRMATSEDRQFLFELHRASMGPYVEELFGPWEDAIQWEFFDRWFRPEETLVVEIAGREVGVVGLQYGTDDVYVTRIEIHPDQQNRRIGTAVLRRVLAEAAKTSRTVSLHVFGINPALDLYHRLGFAAVTEEGDRVFMRASPQDD